MKSNSNLESGIVMTFVIKGFKKLKANEFSNYRGRITMDVRYSIDGKETVLTLKDVVPSNLCGYNMHIDLEKYKGKEFTSLNTSSDFNLNPFMLVKNNDKYYLYMVHENGKYYVDVTLPGGMIQRTVKYKYKKAENYIRFLDADYMRSIKGKTLEQILSDNDKARQQHNQAISSMVENASDIKINEAELAEAN